MLQHTLLLAILVALVSAGSTFAVTESLLFAALAYVGGGMATLGGLLGLQMLTDAADEDASAEEVFASATTGG